MNYRDELCYKLVDFLIASSEFRKEFARLFYPFDEDVLDVTFNKRGVLVPSFSDFVFTFSQRGAYYVELTCDVIEKIDPSLLVGSKVGFLLDNYKNDIPENLPDECEIVYWSWIVGFLRECRNFSLANEIAHVFGCLLHEDDTIRSSDIPSLRDVRSIHDR